MCPFGSAFMKGSNTQKELPDNFDLEGFDPDASDSDDEPLSDIDM